MKKLSVGLSLCLLAATAALTLPAAGRSPARQEVDPDTLRVLWSDKEHRWPAFIPQALIGNLNLTSPETVDLSHLPLLEGQKADLKFFLFAEPDGADGCFTPPIAEHLGLRDASLDLRELLATEQVVTTGIVRKVVPGWLTGVDMAANLFFVEVDEPMHNVENLAIPGQTLVLIQRSGAELVISGKRICSPKTEEFLPTAGSRVLLFGTSHETDADRLRGRIFEIRDGRVYPNQHYEALKASELAPIPLWELRQRLETVTEPER